MKKKSYRIIALIAALLLMAGLGWFANAFVGNPISKMLVKNTAEEYVAKTYAGTDYYIDEIYYSFKDGKYYVDVKSPGSIDSEFSLSLNMNGTLRWDNYEYCVLGKQNTADRLYMEYRKLVDTVMESPAFPFDSDIGFGDLQFNDAIEISKPGDVPEYNPEHYIDKSELVLDGFYDIAELGRKAGRIVLYVYDEVVTVERASEILLEFKKLMDDGGVTFYAVDMVLESPRNEDGTRNSDARVEVDEFLYEDIYEEGLAERIKTANIE